MISSEYFIHDLTTPKDLDYSKPEGVIQRIEHDLAVVIGSLAIGGRYFKAAESNQVDNLANNHPDIYSALRTNVVLNLERIGISTNPDISPPKQGEWLPDGYVRLSQPPTEPLAAEALPA